MIILFYYYYYYLTPSFFFTWSESWLAFMRACMAVASSSIFTFRDCIWIKSACNDMR